VDRGRLLADENEVGRSFGTLRCTLLDRRSSAPVAGARVTCVWRDERVSVLKADARGAFAAEVPEGVYDLVVSARGYLSLFVRGVGVLGGYEQELVRGLVPGEGQAPEGEPCTALAGYVRDRVGRVASGVAIHLNADRHAATYTTRTDRHGAYVLHGVLPGMYDLVVRSGDRALVHEYVAIAHVKELVRRDVRLVQS
jgi:Carboxypeptidase regulatory-like domain